MYNIIFTNSTNNSGKQNKTNYVQIDITLRRNASALLKFIL